MSKIDELIRELIRELAALRAELAAMRATGDGMSDKVVEQCPQPPSVKTHGWSAVQGSTTPGEGPQPGGYLDQARQAIDRGLMVDRRVPRFDGFVATPETSPRVALLSDQEYQSWDGATSLPAWQREEDGE